MENRFEKFSIAVLELNRYLQKIKDQEMRKFGLRSAHTMCVFYLGQHPEGLTVTQLSAICREDKAAVSRCLSQLAERDLVVSDAPRNQRAYRNPYRLTEKGRILAKQVDERVEEALRQGGKGLTEEQRETFYATAQIILENLSNYRDGSIPEGEEA